MKTTKLATYFLLFYVFVGCRNVEQQTTITPQIVIDTKQDEAQKYLNMFVSEAKLRGRTLDVQNVRFTFNDLLKQQGYWGLCDNKNFELGFDSQKITSIVFDADTWNNLNADEKQWLMFHECGHCILSRVHLNQTFDTGESASMMSQGDAGVYGGNVGFSSFKKEYYVNELFNGKLYNTNTPVPDWAAPPAYNTVKKKEIFREKFDDNSNSWAGGTTAISNGYYNLKGQSTAVNAPFKISPTSNFEVEFELKNNESNVFASFAIGSNNIVKTSTNLSVYQNTLFSILAYKEKAMFYITEELPRMNLFSSLGNKLKDNDFNKITIRKIADRLYYYVNEKPVYVAPAPKFTNESPLWLYGNVADIYLDNVSCSVIE